ANGLAFVLPDGSRFGPTDLALDLDEATPAAAAGGRLAVGEIELQPLAAIASHLPLPEAVRRDIVRFAPHGSVRDAHVEWTGELAAPQRYLVAGNVSRFAVASHDGLPGVAGIAGSIEMDQRGGRVHVAGNASTLTLPRIFADPLVFDSITGDVLWQTEAGTTRVQWKGVGFANADLAGTTDGTWSSGPDGPGSVDITGRLTRANLASTYRYVPAVAPATLREWLQRALVKGSTGEARLALAGDLAFFPFAQGKQGRFELDVKAHDVTLAYADRWTPITDAAGDVRVDGAHVAVDASGAHMNGVEIGTTRAEIANWRDARPVLRIKGTARGPTPQFLAFVAASPIAEWIDHVTDGITASGDGELALEFALPLHDPGQTSVTGDYRFASSAVQLAPAVQLAEAAGALAFDEHGIRASAVTAQAFGGPVTLALTAERGHLRVDARGSADVERARTAFDAPALARVSGNTDWQLALDARGGQMAWTLQSSLAGATVDLPAPIGKVASETRPLRVERRATKPQEDTISVDYGRIARVLIHRQTGGTTANVDRALVLVGKAIGDATSPERAGVWIRADVAAIDVDAWLAVDPMRGDGAESTASARTPAIDGVDLQAASATALGRSFGNVKATARRRDGDWRVVLDGSEIAGNATWRSATIAQPYGRISARLTRLSLPPATQGIDAATTTGASDPNHWAAVDLVADSVIRKGRALGKLELVAQPSGADWQITKLSLANDAGRIDAHGSWRDASTRSQTQLDVAIDVREAGAFLGRFGWPDAVKAAPTRIEGQVSWAGSPSDFDYPSLAGRLTLHTGAGQFTKLEPGMGRLLGVLSLQALPRRVSLDFRDVFSEGFAFDTITGDVRIDRGVMHTGNLRLSGPAAGVDIAGEVDLAHETQKLDVRVQPSLSTGVSAGAAALFIANPLLGAAIGAGTLLAQKMLNNPFDQLFSYRYTVSGSFDDPVVARANARAASAESSSATIR
ncbi:MAG TPA: YhdP family protein, partial [Casimicrobiaceae bacterium]|nr:YhdP family protein [Casimicrobiaceae bacterium]